MFDRGTEIRRNGCVTPIWSIEKRHIDCAQRGRIALRSMRSVTIASVSEMSSRISVTPIEAILVAGTFALMLAYWLPPRFRR